MQAIRTLRGVAHARAASPAASASDQLTEESTSQHQHKTVSTTTTTSNAAAANNNHNSSTALSRIQTLAKLRRLSPPTSPAPPPTPPPTLVQDGSYLQALGLKLNEATSRALAPVFGTGSDCLKGRRPLPPGRGKALGALISSELTAARENPNLERAILRLLTRSLSVLVTTLAAQLSPLIVCPHYVPTSCTLPPAQWDASTQHGLALAAFCTELLEVFATHSLGDARSPDLGVVKATIENAVMRLTSPLFTALQGELIGCLESATKPAVYKPAGRAHPALQQFQLLAPHAGRVLRRYAVDGGGTSKITESQLAGVLIAVSWAGMLALVCRPTGIKLLGSPSISGTPPFSGSPGKTPNLALPGSKTGRTPPSTPKLPLRLLKDKDHPNGSSPNAFTLVSLPVTALTPVSASTASSRPPSPPLVEVSPLVLDFRVFLEVLERELPRPPAQEGLAGEAVEEAFGRVRALGDWISRGFNSQHNQNHVMASALKDFLNPQAAQAKTDNNGDDDEEEEEEEIPFLLALELLLRHRLGVEHGAAAFLGMDEELYKKRCLSGFGRADEWACTVGLAVCKGLKTATQGQDAWVGVGVGVGFGVREDKKQVVQEWITARVDG